MRPAQPTTQPCRGRSSFWAIGVPTCADVRPKNSGGPSTSRPAPGSTRHCWTPSIRVAHRRAENGGGPRPRPGGRVRSEADSPVRLAQGLPGPQAAPRGNCHRRGITLFEVMLALAIFLGAFAAIGQVIDLGRQASVEGQLENEAVLRAQTKLAEVIAGVEPMTALQAQPFEDDPNWTWSLTMGDAPHVDVLGLTITVEHNRPNGTVDAAFVLTRFVRDPQLFIDAAANASLSGGL